MPKDWDAKEYFAGCYGIIAGLNKDIEPIKLKVSAGQVNYIRDLPLHESQKEIERNGEYCIFTYQMRNTPDLIQELLWNGSDVEVLEPETLRKDMANRIKMMWDKYKNDKK